VVGTNLSATPLLCITKQDFNDANVFSLKEKIASAFDIPSSFIAMYLGAQQLGDDFVLSDEHLNLLSVRLFGTGFNLCQLRDAGFNARQLKDAGFHALQLKDAGFNAERLKDAGFDAEELKDAGLDAR